MKISIPSLYSDYLRYIDELRAIPYYLDCLKPVERRLLIGMHETARKKFTKSAKVVGNVIGHLHPHGDASTYDALVHMQHRGLIQKQGNWGNPKKLKPSQYAAYRYTECKVNDEIDNYAFELIKYVDYGDPENLQEEQALYLSTPIPIGLIGSGIITGIACNTVCIPRYKFEDLVKRLSYLLQLDAGLNPDPVIIYPNFPGCNLYPVNGNDFETILTNGTGIIHVSPVMQVEKDGISVYGKPPVGVSSWLKEDPNKPRIFNVDDLYSKTKCFHAWFTPKQGKITQQHVDEVFKLIQTKVHVICNCVNDAGLAKLYSIDNLLRFGYNKWVNCLEKKYNNDKIGIVNKIFELKVISIIRQIVNQHAVNLKNVDTIVGIFKSTYALQYPDVTEDNIRTLCSKYTIKSLFEHHIDIQEWNIKLQEVDNILNNLATTAYTKLLNYKISM